MASQNLLLNPIPELEAALKANTWGLKPSSTILVAESFPVTPEDIAAVREEAKAAGGACSRVVGKIKLVTLEETEMVVVLTQEGFTIDQASGPHITHPGGAYETLETLLIATSPLYVEAMANEVAKRFQGYSQSNEDEDEEELEKAEGGDKEVWL